MNFTIIVEKAENNYCAFSPNMNGCVATGDTLIDTIRNYANTLDFHLQSIKKDSFEQ